MILIIEVIFMAGTKPVKLYTPKGEAVDSAELSEDFRSAERCGPYRVGERAFYYRSGLRQHCLPYDGVGRVFKRAMLCASRTCGKVVHTDTFWLVFTSGADELAEARTIDEKHADRALELLRTRMPAAAFGK